MLTVSDKANEPKEIETNETPVVAASGELSPKSNPLASSPVPVLDDTETLEDDDLDDDEEDDFDEDLEDEDEDFDDDEEDDDFDDEDEDDDDLDDEEEPEDEVDDDGASLSQANVYDQLNALTSSPLFAQVSQLLGGKQSPVDQSFTRARMLQAGGDLEGSAQIYLDVIEENPEYFKAYEALGQVLLAMDKPQEAETFLIKATELNPADPNGYLYLGYAYYAQEQYTKCVENFAKTVELDPQNHLAANNLGYAHYLNGDLEAASDSFTLAGDWGSDRAYYNLGMVRLLQDKPKESALAYQDAADLDPSGKQIEDHLDDLVTALEKHPGQATALNRQIVQLQERL